MNYSLVVIGNGRRDCLAKAIESVGHLKPAPTHLYMVNDTGNENYAAYLDATYPQFDMILHHGVNKGMAAAVQDGWALALDDPACEYCFHLEEDFVLTRDVPIQDMALILGLTPNLASITLKRPPWAGIELTCGDQLAAIIHESTWTAHYGEYITFHNHIFSLNPSLIKREVMEMGWPSGPLGVGNESGMTKKLLEAGYFFSVWGTVKDEPVCEHIGYQRGSEWQL